MSLLLQPIGVFSSHKKYPYDAARQAAYDVGKSDGFLELYPHQNFEQGLLGLEGCSHIWVIYQFHLNSGWNPLVQPPRGAKQGVFATRSPYRPNSLGLSALKVRSLQGLRIEVEAHDLLDGTPIFDIKPYHPEVDSIPTARLTWLEDLGGTSFQIELSTLAGRQIEFLESNGLTELRNFLAQQLAYDPLDHKKKRVFKWQDKGVIAYRTWRCLFSIDGSKVHLESIYSGYSREDLANLEDKYQDKHLHREFNANFEIENKKKGDLPRFK